MIIAAGQGAAAAQAINRDLFEESLKNHSLRRFRDVQLEEGGPCPKKDEGSGGGAAAEDPRKAISAVGEAESAKWDNPQRS